MNHHNDLYTIKTTNPDRFPGTAGGNTLIPVGVSSTLSPSSSHPGTIPAEGGLQPKCCGKFLQVMNTPPPPEVEEKKSIVQTLDVGIPVNSNTIILDAQNFTSTVMENRKRSLESLPNAGNTKKNKKHDSTPVMDYILTAAKINNFEVTGMILREGIMGYEEEKFFQWVCTQKPEDYQDIKLSSFFEKFDKSRPVNRVNRSVKYGPILFLKIEKQRYSHYPLLLEKIGEMERMLSHSKLKFLTHRDWNCLALEEFNYNKID